MSAYGHQQKFRNFEKFGAILGQNGIPGLPTVNGSVLNGKVSVINGRPTQTVTFKLTHALLALRVSKPEGGKRSVTYMGSKVVNLVGLSKPIPWRQILHLRVHWSYLYL